MSRMAAWVGLGVWAIGCQTPVAPGDRAGAPHPVPTTGVGSATTPAAPDTEPGEDAAPPSPPAPTSGVAVEGTAPPYPVGEVVKVSVPGDHPIYVVHAPPGVDQALLYLHGVCGNPTAFDTWTEAIVPFGTLVSLQGDEPCKGSQRRRWTGDIGSIERRAQAALRRVGEERGEPIRTDAVTLLGYSQGALRAEALAARSPQTYPRVILMGGPLAPSTEHLEDALAVVLMAGERDKQRHLREAARDLAATGTPATFLEIPGAGHGEYGPRAAEVMRAALQWAFDQAPVRPPPSPAP